mgnify:CR=1 FL=1
MKANWLEMAEQKLGKILVIDDDAIVTETIGILFDQELTVLSAASGKEGIEAAQSELPEPVQSRDHDSLRHCHRGIGVGTHL